MIQRASALLYQPAQYGTPGYFGGKHDFARKPVFRNATEQVFAHQLTPKAALDEARVTIDALLANGQEESSGPARRGAGPGGPRLVTGSGDQGRR